MGCKHHSDCQDGQQCCDGECASTCGPLTPTTEATTTTTTTTITTTTTTTTTTATTTITTTTSACIGMEEITRSTSYGCPGGPENSNGKHCKTFLATNVFSLDVDIWEGAATHNP